MSKIVDNMRALSQYNFALTIDSIIEDFPIRDIKEYILYLQKENERKDKEIKELVIENAQLTVNLESKIK